ncbi:MAG: lactate utilization protein [Ruminococcus sp.]|jgi:L-lactate utilization protein LutB|nr:lactate utilization protein [Ruminococcus sp.]MBQ1381843.1 lactate utilization protein [Ruminococcus sp.]MBQ1687403.1 lactate utilization protein [Ruminococcus sp.]MBQ1806403.1 lactate utilization protein [Ruminococcus sp.]MBQ1813990.1 lactate utilization protein [Ruminococcus sp.]
MDEAMKARVEATLKNLKRNRMEAYYVDTKEQACDLVKTLVQPGATVSCGGSVTLKQTGVYDIIASGDYDFLDRSACKTAEETDALYRQVFSADAFFTSANAVTENGELYNVDGNSNRVAAIVFGPKSVICVCGVNKLVKNIDEAIRRVKTKAAPPNTVRLGIETPCAKTGACISLKQEDPDMCAGCHGDGRICCNYVVSAQQRHINRIKVIIIGEEYGY